MSLNAVVLAAGKGTRMNSQSSKMLLSLGGRPLLHYLMDTLSDLNNCDITLVLGYQSEKIEQSLQHYTFDKVYQDTPLGTGHAVQQAFPVLRKHQPNYVLVLPGDSPFIQKETLEKMLTLHQRMHAKATVLSAVLDDPGAYGRILRDSNNQLMAIREFKDCSKKEAAINEINSGIYLFNLDVLLSNLPQLKNDNAQNEFYLPDIVECLHQSAQVVASYCLNDPQEILGVNTPEDLALLRRLVPHFS
ncbi:MAG: NTP transferase domain-containing protein [bacterium]